MWILAKTAWRTEIGRIDFWMKKVHKCKNDSNNEQAVTATMHFKLPNDKQSKSSRFPTRFAVNWEEQISPNHSDFESLPDSKSPWSSAAANVRRHCRLRQIGNKVISLEPPRFWIASRFKIAATKRGSKRQRAPPARRHGSFTNLRGFVHWLLLTIEL